MKSKTPRGGPEASVGIPDVHAGNGNSIAVAEHAPVADHA